MARNGYDDKEGAVGSEGGKVGKRGKKEEKSPRAGICFRGAGRRNPGMLPVWQ